MKAQVNISIYEAVGSHICVASSSGEGVYERIADALEKDTPVTLSFLNVEIMSLAFLNVAIGQLYGKFPEGKIRELLKVVEIEQEDIKLLKIVVNTAKIYFKDKGKFEQAMRDAEDD